MNPDSLRMKKIYKNEMGHFLACIDPKSDDVRLKVPEETVMQMAECLIDDLEREEMNGGE
jgi:hypothetical protein